MTPGSDIPPRPRPGQLTFTAPRRARPPRHLADLTMAQRREALRELGLPAFRAAQLSVHYFDRLVTDPAQMTDLPATQRAELVQALLPTLLTPVRTLTADAGATVKTVWRLHDGALVESVVMRYPDRVTICVSSQAGCGMNCPFCATGQGGLTRNLSTAEIVEQAHQEADTILGQSQAQADSIRADAQAVVALEIVCGDGTVNTAQLTQDHALACAFEVLRGYDVGYNG